MPIGKFELPDGSVAKFEFSEGTTPEQAQEWFDANSGDILKNVHEDVYDADSGATIRAPKGMAADEIQYRDAIQNRGDNESSYYGHTKITGDKSIYDSVMDVVAAPMDMLSAGTAQGISTVMRGASGMTRIASDVGLIDEETADMALKMNAQKYEKIDASIQQRLNKYKTGGLGDYAVDVVSGVGQLPTMIGLASPLGIAVIGGALTTSSAERLYQEVETKTGDDATATATAYSLAPAVTVLDVAFERLFVKGVTTPIKQQAIKNIGKSMGLEFASEAAPELLESSVLTSMDVRDLTVGQILANTAYAGAVGAGVGGAVSGGNVLANKFGAKEAATRIEEIYSEAEANDLAGKPVDQEAITKQLAEAEIPMADKIGEVIAKAVPEANSKITDAVNQQIRKVNEKPDLAEDFLKTIKAVEEGDKATAAMMFEKAGMDQKAVSAAIANIKEPKPALPSDKTVDQTNTGRLKKLDTDISTIDRNIDQLLTIIEERAAQGKPNKANDARLEKLLDNRDVLDEERANILTAETKAAKSDAMSESSKKNIIVKGDTIAKAEQQAAVMSERALNQGMREGRMLAKADTAVAQKKVTEIIKQSGLELKDQAKLIDSIKRTQTTAQLDNAIRKVESRINALRDKSTRSKAIASIKKSLKKAKQSETIAVDYVSKLQDMFNEIDLVNRNQDTIDSLNKTLDFMLKDGGAVMPKDVLERLSILNKKRVADIDTEELAALAEKANNLIETGKLKYKSYQKKNQMEKEKFLASITGNVNKIESDKTRPMVNGYQEALNNELAKKSNYVNIIRKAAAPIDIMLDIADGFKKYNGEMFNFFKRKTQELHDNYLNRYEDLTRGVKDISNKYELGTENHQRVLIHGALQQEGGRERLLATGLTDAEIDAIKLSDAEMELYRAMRAKFDEILPAVKDTMRVVYNKNVNEVKEYFPFAAAFESMTEFNIEDRIANGQFMDADKKNVEQGFTKSRTKKMPKIDINAMNVFLNYMRDATYLVDLGGHIKQMGEVALSKEFGEIVGDITQELVVDYVDLMARRGSAKGLNHAGEVLRSNIGLAVLGLKLPTVMIQPLALIDTAMQIGGKYTAKGVEAVTNKEWREFMHKHMPDIRERVGDDPEYMNYGGWKVTKKVHEYAFWALKGLDKLTASASAAGAYIQYMESRGLEVDLENPNKDAIYHAQFVMRRANSSAFAKDAPLLLSQGKITGSVTADKFILQFQSFMLNRWATLRHEIGHYGFKEGERDYAIQRMMFFTVALGAEVMVRDAADSILSAIFGGDREDEEEDYYGKLAQTAVQQIPIVSQAYSFDQYNSVPIPVVGYFKTLTDRKMWADMTKEDSREAIAYTRVGALAVGAAGVPGMMQLDQILGRISRDMKAKEKSTKNSDDVWDF
jgi:hypothetical protein